MEQPDKVNYYEFDYNNITTVNGAAGGIELSKGSYIGGAGVTTFGKPLVGWGMNGSKGLTGPQGSQGAVVGTSTLLQERFSGYRATVPDWNGAGTSNSKYAVGGNTPNWGSPNAPTQNYYLMETAQTDTFNTQDLIDSGFHGQATPGGDLTGGFIRVTALAWMSDQVFNATYLGRVRISVKKFDVVPNSQGLATPTDQPTATIIENTSYQIAPNAIPGPLGAYSWSFEMTSDGLTSTRNDIYKLGFSFEVEDTGGNPITLDTNSPWSIKWRMEYCIV